MKCRPGRESGTSPSRRTTARRSSSDFGPTPTRHQARGATTPCGFGWNAGRHAGDGSWVPGEAAVYMGFESSYFDPVDGTQGPEWYVGCISPDGTTVDVGDFRPFYARWLNPDDPEPSAYVHADIGSGEERPVHRLGRRHRESSVLRPTGHLLLPEPARRRRRGAFGPKRRGDRRCCLDRRRRRRHLRPAGLRLGGVSGGGFLVQEPNTFQYTDKNGTPRVLMRYGSSVSAAVLDVASSLKVQGDMASMAPTRLPRSRPLQAHVAAGQP